MKELLVLLVVFGIGVLVGINFDWVKGKLVDLKNKIQGGG